VLTRAFHYDPSVSLDWQNELTGLRCRRDRTFLRVFMRTIYHKKLISLICKI